jgi:NAD(P)-dependent dehydrogenase (short-subunit alcohol dehydrogenase family)
MKNVLIVGGSSGIGNACVNLFNEMGWGVYATFFSNKKITLIDKSPTIWSFLDITDKKQVSSFVKILPKMDAVIICASQNRTESSGFCDKDIDLIFETNVISQIRLIQSLEKKLNKKSSVILFSSITGKIGSARRVAYSSSKSAIYGLVKSLAADFAPNIRVNAVCPGYIKTAQYVRNSTIKEKERKKNILLNRLGSPEEVAKLVLFLASDDSSYINGQSINIDDGVL